MFQSTRLASPRIASTRLPLTSSESTRRVLEAGPRRTRFLRSAIHAIESLFEVSTTKLSARSSATFDVVVVVAVVIVGGGELHGELSVDHLLGLRCRHRRHLTLAAADLSEGRDNFSDDGGLTRGRL